jgi:hypothetical protein
MRMVLRGSELRFTGQKPQVPLHLLIVSISICAASLPPRPSGGTRRGPTGAGKDPSTSSGTAESARTAPENAREIAPAPDALSAAKW